MTPSRPLMSAFTLVAVGVLGLSACAGEKPSGLAPFTPSASNGSPSPTSSSAVSSLPTNASKWTTEQQQVIDGVDKFINLQTAISSKTERINVLKFRQVATEPFATVTLKGIQQALSAGYVQTGRTVNKTSSVTVVGKVATVKTCLDQTKLNLINPTHPNAPRWEPRPPSRRTVSMVRVSTSWLVTRFNGGEGACIGG